MAMTQTAVGPELKHALRKMEFPFCCRESLNRLEQYCSRVTSSGTNRNVRQMHMYMDLISEFVFCEVDRRGVKKRRLSAIQELQLLEVFCDFLSWPVSNEAGKNTVFMSCFHSSCPERIHLLIKLVSMSICTDNAQALNCTAILMQQVGSTSKYSIQLVQGIVNDFFVLVPNALDKFKEIPKNAPLFATNFLTAVAEIYYINKVKTFIPPPKVLLEVITEWIEEYRTLCLTALLVNLQPALPLGGIPMPAVTPFTGLMRWCILSPFSPDDGTNLIYSKLQLLLLKSLAESDWNQRGSNVVNAQSLTAIIPLIMQKLNSDSLALEKSINMLAQAVHISLYSKAMYGNKQDLMTQLEQLPYNRLLKIVMKEHCAVI